MKRTVSSEDEGQNPVTSSSEEEEEGIDIVADDRYEQENEKTHQVQEEENNNAPPQAKPDGPRLAIKSLVLENFKSYANEQEVGPFHTCFSAIVGPNGSGKSNVIDAILFVFGKQAKQLRLNKVSELIHHSENYSDLPQAKVSVNFHDVVPKDNGYTVVPGSQFSLSRVAYKNNTSSYFINDKKVKREEVVSRLKERGIDLDNNRFLILQGEVEQIAMMKPKGRGSQEVGLLEYLEDIIGSDKYVKPIEDAATALENLNEERVERFNRVKIAIKEKENLEGAKVEAETYLLKERGVVDRQSIIYQIQRLNAEEKSKRYESKKVVIEEQLQEHRNKMQSFVDSLKDLEKKYKKENQEVDILTVNLNKAKSKLIRFERQRIQLAEETKHLKDKLKKLKKDVERSEGLQSSKQETLESNKKDIESNRKKSSKLETPQRKKKF